MSTMCFILIIKFQFIPIFRPFCEQEINQSAWAVIDLFQCRCSLFIDIHSIYVTNLLNYCKFSYIIHIFKFYAMIYSRIIQKYKYL